ncbi:protein of unknown function (plasmid) [Ralstonia solanacearum PSI07]|nr:protein of unknown function [Ralstonia solanacearum PSI07]
MVASALPSGGRGLAGSDGDAQRRRKSVQTTWNLPFKSGYTPAAEACASAATDVGIVSNGITQTITQIPATPNSLRRPSP